MLFRSVGDDDQPVAGLHRGVWLRQRELVVGLADFSVLHDVEQIIVGEKNRAAAGGA